MPKFVWMTDPAGNSYAVAPHAAKDGPVSGYRLRPDGSVENAQFLQRMTLEEAGIVFMCHGLHQWLATDDRVKVLH